MNLNKRQQLLAIFAIGAIGILVADKIIFTPLTRAWRSRSEEIASLKKQFKSGTDTLKFEKSWHEQWDRMRTNTLSTDKPVAEGQMLKAFERWTRDAGVSVTSIRPQWKESQDEYKTLECRADIAGSLSSVAKFLYHVEQDPMGVKVDSMELTSHNTDGSQLVLVVQVSGLLINAPTVAAKPGK